MQAVANTVTKVRRKQGPAGDRRFSFIILIIFYFLPSDIFAILIFLLSLTLSQMHVPVNLLT